MFELTVDNAEYILATAYEVWLYIDDDDMSRGIELLLGKMLMPGVDAEDDYLVWFAQQALTGMRPW